MPWQQPSRRTTLALANSPLGLLSLRHVAPQVKIRPLGPGMVQQIQQRCSTCGGAGYSCPPSDRCTACGGKGLAPNRKVFEVRLGGHLGFGADGCRC